MAHYCFLSPKAEGIYLYARHILRGQALPIHGEFSLQGAPKRAEPRAFLQ